MTNWQFICLADDIPLKGSRRVRRSEGADIALFRTSEGEVFALLDRCPHKGGPLSQGIVFGRHVACPLHNWAISLEDGQARAPDAGCAVKFTVQVAGGRVMLDANEIKTLGLQAAAANTDAVCG